MSRTGTSFYERRAVPWWWWLVALALTVPSVQAVVVLGPDMTTHGSWQLALTCCAVTVAVVAVLLLALSRSAVEVDRHGVRAGGDLLPANAIGRVRALDRGSTRLVLGRHARADAHLSIRPWVHTAVQIQVIDPGDRTPYWLVGTRRPAELARAVTALRGGLRAAYGGDELADADTGRSETS
jgi:hypothetical protein